MLRGPEARLTEEPCNGASYLPRLAILISYERHALHAELGRAARALDPCLLGRPGFGLRRLPLVLQPYPATAAQRPRLGIGRQQRPARGGGCHDVCGGERGGPADPWEGAAHPFAADLQGRAWA